MLSWFSVESRSCMFPSSSVSMDDRSFYFCLQQQRQDENRNHGVVLYQQEYVISDAGSCCRVRYIRAKMTYTYTPILLCHYIDF